MHCIGNTYVLSHSMLAQLLYSDRDERELTLKVKSIVRVSSREKDGWDILLKESVLRIEIAATSAET